MTQDFTEPYPDLCPVNQDGLLQMGFLPVDSDVRRARERASVKIGEGERVHASIVPSRNLCGTAYERGLLSGRSAPRVEPPESRCRSVANRLVMGCT